MASAPGMPCVSLWVSCPESALNLNSFRASSVSSQMGPWLLLPGAASGLQNEDPLLALISPRAPPGPLLLSQSHQP